MNNNDERQSKIRAFEFLDDENFRCLDQGTKFSRVGSSLFFCRCVKPECPAICYVTLDKDSQEHYGYVVGPHNHQYHQYELQDIDNEQDERMSDDTRELVEIIKEFKAYRLSQKYVHKLKDPPADIGDQYLLDLDAAPIQFKATKENVFKCPHQKIRFKIVVPASLSIQVGQCVQRGCRAVAFVTTDEKWDNNVSLGLIEGDHNHAYEEDIEQRADTFEDEEELSEDVLHALEILEEFDVKRIPTKTVRQHSGV